MNLKKLNKILLCSLMLFSMPIAEENELIEPINETQEETPVIEETTEETEILSETPVKKTTNNTDDLVFNCRSSVRIYNNTSQTITIYNGPDTDVIESGSFSYTFGECGTTVEYNAEGTFPVKDGSEKVCSVKSDGVLKYPEEEGTYEDISITSLCGDSTSIEINSLSNVDIKNLSKVAIAQNPESYVYGIEITAKYEDKYLEGISFSAVRNGIIAKDVFGNEATTTTNSDGKAYLYLFAGYTYSIEQSDTNDVYSIVNGEITVDSTNATVLAKNGFEINNIEEYTKITFKNGLSEKELQIRANIESERNNLYKWKETQINKIKEVYNQVDFSKYNTKQLSQLEDVLNSEYVSLDSVVKQYEDKIDNNIRNDIKSDYQYSLDQFKNNLAITPHWQHWLIIVVLALSLVLHFIFNKHLLIDLTILLGIGILAIDYCKMSLILLGVLVAINLIITLIGLKVDTDYEEIDDEYI